MYKRILVPIDNSPYSELAVGTAIDLAQRFGAEVTGIHVYAARLHDERFKQMEEGLPSRYQEKQTLEKQRNIHNTLIGQGLHTISDSYIDGFQRSCEAAKVAFNRKVVEGQNYVEILKEAADNPYDLIVMGILGLGAVDKSSMGSVCGRVAARTRTDILIAKAQGPPDGKVMVAIDGSAYATAALQSALELARDRGAAVEVVSVFDPNFHVRAFNSIAGVLSEEASKSFRFKDQERLHEEIINGGMAKIYRGHLEGAGLIASQKGQKIESTLLSGKPFEAVLKHVEEEKPSLLVLGRFGTHWTEGLDMGSTTDNLLRLAPCNVLIANR